MVIGWSKLEIVCAYVQASTLESLMFSYISPRENIHIIFYKQKVYSIQNIYTKIYYSFIFVNIHIIEKKFFQNNTFFTFSIYYLIKNYKFQKS